MKIADCDALCTPSETFYAVTAGHHHSPVIAGAFGTIRFLAAFGGALPLGPNRAIGAAHARRATRSAPPEGADLIALPLPQTEVNVDAVVPAGRAA